MSVDAEDAPEWLRPLPSDGSKGIWVLAAGKEIGFRHIPAETLFSPKELGGMGARVIDGMLVLENQRRGL
jgi:hypothetical protein